MSAATMTPDTTAVASQRNQYRLTFGRLVRSEFYKLSTLKSTWWILAINAFLFPAASAAVVAIMRFFSSAVTQLGDATGTSVTPVAISQAMVWSGIGFFAATFQMILVAIFGILSFTGELSANTIQNTYAANPKRSGPYFGKAIAVFVMGFASSVVGTLLAWGIGELLVNGVKVTPLPDDLALQVPLVSIVGIAAVVAAMGVFGLAIGGLIQSSLGAIFTALGILYLLPEIFQLFTMLKPQWAWSATITRILPPQAIQNFNQAGGEGLTQMLSASASVSADAMSASQGAASEKSTQMMNSAIDMMSGAVGWAPTWWQSGLIVLGWAVVFMLVGWLVAKRRDIK
jgi:ABC-2 type transport system permease protein